jgi:hypothetical protein
LGKIEVEDAKTITGQCGIIGPGRQVTQTLCLNGLPKDHSCQQDEAHFSQQERIAFHFNWDIGLQSLVKLLLLIIYFAYFEVLVNYLTF